MGCLKLAFSLLKQHKIFNLVYVLELALVMLVLSLMYNFVQTTRLDVNSLEEETVQNNVKFPLLFTKEAKCREKVIAV